MKAKELAGLIAARLGPGAVSEVSDAGHTVSADVPSRRWLDALAIARDELDCDRFDWLSAVDELPDGFAIVAHVWSPAGQHHLLIRTRVGGDAPHLPTATRVYRAAAGHERQVEEAFCITFDGHPDPSTLLLPGPCRSTKGAPRGSRRACHTAVLSPRGDPPRGSPH